MEISEFLNRGRNAENQKSEPMNISEFLLRNDEELSEKESEEVPDPEELDVQKAVVESLAADKAEQDERISQLMKDNLNLKKELQIQREKIAEMSVALSKVGDLISKNSEGEMSNKISLLDRNAEIDDKFIGETRDHILEVLKAAFDVAEKEGRIRLAQILESVLAVNEPSGNLVKNRTEIEKLFADNGNILSGPVIEELERRGIPHKKENDYLLPSEIIKRTF